MISMKNQTLHSAPWPRVLERPASQMTTQITPIRESHGPCRETSEKRARKPAETLLQDSFSAGNCRRMQTNPSGLSELTFFAAWPHYECFVSVAVLVAVKPFREKRFHPAENRCDWLSQVLEIPEP